MGRQYPRFLFSNPKDTKSAGPFIVHTIEPRLIAKVTFATDGYHYVDALDVFTPTSKEKIDQVIYAMHDWYTAVRMKQAKLSNDFYIRSSEIASRLGQLDSFFQQTVSISMLFQPKMGAKIEIKKDGWDLSINLSNDDTYETVVKKLKQQFRVKYSKEPNWSI